MRPDRDANLYRQPWFVAGGAVLAAAILILECAQPYYFTQDDVLVGELPYLLHVCRSVWSGVVPEYNPYNLLGSPCLAEGYGGTYPPLYLAYAFARHVLGDEYATAEVLAVGHLAVGYVVMFLVGRRLGLRGMAACLAALSFVLSGPILIMGRGWHAFLLPAVLSPLLVLAAERLKQGPVGWRWGLGVAAVIGLYYHGGFPQLCLFALVFFALHLTALGVSGTVPLRRLLRAIPALLAGAALAMPLFYQQWRLARDMTQVEAYGPGIASHLLSFLLPYPLQRDCLPYAYGSMHLDYGAHGLYYGTLMAVLFLLAAGEWLAALLRLRTLPKGTHVFTFCALIALWLSLGPAGQLWKLTHILPFGLRNHPFRVAPFFVMFSVLSGGWLLERFLRWWNGRWPWESVLGALGCLLLLYHASCAQTAFYTYGFSPYPELPADYAALLRSPAGSTAYRSVSCVPLRSVDPTYAYALPLSLATVYRLPAFYGYDPVIQNKPAFAHAWDLLRQDVTGGCRAYGLRWIVVHRTIRRGNRLSASNSRDLETTCVFLHALKSAPIVKQHAFASLDEAVSVLEVGGADPLCFCEGESSRPLPAQTSGQGIDVALGGLTQARTLVVNFLYYPDMQACVDGKEVPITTDRWLRMVVAAPAGAQQLAVRYRPPWWQGVAAGLGLAALAAALLLALQRWALDADYAAADP